MVTADYELDREIGVRLLTGTRDSLLDNIRTGCGTRMTSYAMANGEFSPE